MSGVIVTSDPNVNEAGFPPRVRPLRPHLAGLVFRDDEQQDDVCRRLLQLAGLESRFRGRTPGAAAFELLRHPQDLPHGTKVVAQLSLALWAAVPEGEFVDLLDLDGPTLFAVGELFAALSTGRHASIHRWLEETASGHE